MIRNVLFLVMFVLPGMRCSAQTLHALLFVNENEEGRQTDRREDMKQMHAFFQYVAECIDYDYSPVRCSDRDFTSEKVDREIDRLQVRDNDVVVFYYSGHGYNAGQDIWPTLSLLDRRYSQASIMQRLKSACKERAKLILCIADCCNKGMADNSDISTVFANEDRAAIRALFLGFNGHKSILMSASKQGQVSWSNLRYGSYFGISLRKAIMRMELSEADWDSVMRRASTLTRKYTKQQQEPQYSISQSSDPFE